MTRRLALAPCLLLAACASPVVMESYLAVIHISPTNGAGNVSLDTEVTAIFSEPLVDDTVSATNVFLADSHGDRVDAALVYNDELWTVFLAPAGPLDPGAHYDFVLRRGLQGADSGFLATEIRTEFATSGGVDEGNVPPTADAGDDQSVLVGATVWLDGSASMDPNDDDITWFWEFIDLPDGSAAVFDDATLEEPSFVADIEGTYVIALTVSNGTHDSTPDYVQVDAAAE